MPELKQGVGGVLFGATIAHFGSKDLSGLGIFCRPKLEHHTGRVD